MSAENKFEKDLLEATAPKKPKETEAVEKTVDDLLKSTLSGLGLEAETKRHILSGVHPEAGKAEPQAVPPRPPLTEKKEPFAPRGDVSSVKPREPSVKVESSSWLKEPAHKPEPSIFKPEPPAKKAEPQVLKEKKGKAVYPELSKKDDVFAGTFAQPDKKKSKPIVPIIAGGAVIIVAAVVFLVLGGKKEPAPDIRQAATNVQPDVKSVSSDPSSLPSSDIAIVSTDSKVLGAAEPSAAGDTSSSASSAPEKRQASETPAISESSTTPLMPLNPNVGRVQEIKPTRTQPTAAETSGNAATGSNAAPSAPKATLGQLVPLTDADSVPVLVRRVEPEYPPLASRMKAEGTVTVNALIDETGAVVRTEVLKASGSPYGFEKASRDAVMRWRYRPAVKDGTYVKVWMPVVVSFTIK